MTPKPGRAGSRFLLLCLVVAVVLAAHAAATMRASRLLRMLLLLQNRGRLTSADLARELEVARRTVLRDVEALGEATGRPARDIGYAGRKDRVAIARQWFSIRLADEAALLRIEAPWRFDPGGKVQAR